MVLEALSVAEDAGDRGHLGVPPEGPDKLLPGAPDLCTDSKLDRSDWG